jgi:two-component system sensor histidine kinase PilS (NtrC family)
MTAEGRSLRAGEVSVVRYIFFRLILCAGLFGMAAALVLAQPWVMFTMSMLFNVAAVVFLFMAISAAGIRKYGDQSWFRWSQLLFDTVLVTTLVWLSDGPRSPFFVLYFMNIVAAAWLLPRWGAVAVAGIDAVVFGVTTAAGLYGFTEWEVVTSGALLYAEMAMRLLSLLLVGMLSGHLSENLQRTQSALAGTVRAVERLEAEHHVVLNQLGTGILVVDEDDRIEALNPAGLTILGSVVGRSVLDVLVPQGEVWEQDYALGEVAKVLVCRRQRLEDGGYVVVVEDLTDWRRMEERIERKERLAAVGRLAAGLAHEIRNPLASLSGAVQMMQNESEDELHGIVLREVANINEMVQDLLDIARPLQLRVAPTDICSIVDDVVRAFEQDHRYQGRCTVVANMDEVPQIQIDGNRVRQVLWNLVLNAAQATIESGSIRIQVRVWQEGWSLSVEDEGVGIPVNQIVRIFDPFYTTRSGGTGLGLANVERIVRAHGGEVDVRSIEGKGSCFTLRLPSDAQSASLEPSEGVHDAS